MSKKTRRLRAPAWLPRQAPGCRRSVSRPPRHSVPQRPAGNGCSVKMHRTPAKAPESGAPSNRCRSRSNPAMFAIGFERREKPRFSLYGAILRAEDIAVAASFRHRPSWRIAALHHAQRPPDTRALRPRQQLVIARTLCGPRVRRRVAVVGTNRNALIAVYAIVEPELSSRFCASALLRSHL